MRKMLKVKRAGRGRPVTGRSVKRLIALHDDVSAFLSAEKGRTGKAICRIIEDLVRPQMALKPEARAY